jgi:cbb3-type cytochrome oxidase cytochrome c subunit
MTDLQKDERYYKINTLNKWFMICCLVLFLSLVWTLLDDYFREWKGYQRDFRGMEVETTRSAISEKMSEVEEQEEYQDLATRLEEANTVFEEKSVELVEAKSKLSEIEERQYRDTQAARFVVADYDVAKYQYEQAVARGAGSVERTKNRLDELNQRKNELRLLSESSERDMIEQQAVIDAFSTDINEIQRDINVITKEVNNLQIKLSVVDLEAMSFANKIGNWVRDLPVLDFLQPYQKINQVVISDIVDNVNFAQVPKVDRCITCHQGILSSEYENEENPFKAHPRLNLFVASSSAHPVEEFGCTSCHGGRGRGTDFSSAAHVPSTPEQQIEWEDKYGWVNMKHWEAPMNPMKNVEAGCLSCHYGETFIAGADQLNLGLNLVERSGCFGCHVIEKYKDKRRIGPDLNQIASKTNKDWAMRWINNPKSFRHNTWMPKFFGQSNNGDPESIKRTDQEIQAIVHYLFSNSNDFEMNSVKRGGNAKNGEELVASIGCLGCHRIESEEIERETSLQSLRRDHGPNLIGVGSKTTEEWVYNWLKTPEAYFPETKMPNLRLTDLEAADLSTYLLTLKQDEFMDTPFPEINEEIQDEIAVEFLNMTMSEVEALSEMELLTIDEKLAYNGDKLIRFYGCYGCHNIPGFDDEKPIGTELSFEGSKSVERLDFGFVDIDHTRQAWFTQKLKEPRIFDRDKVKLHSEKLHMPNFEYSDKEVEAIATVLLGLVEEKALESKIYPRTPKNLFVEEGQWIVREYNCQGCHIIENDGGAIQPMVTDWLMNYDNRAATEAAAITPNFSPPNLIGEGKKVQTNWLFHFMRNPDTIRPWLKVRMPTFAFTEAQTNIMVRYFSFLDDQDFPFVDIQEPNLTAAEIDAGIKLFSKDYFSCGSCHIAGDVFPGGSPDNWAPNFALAKDRLKPDWIIDWIMDPQSLMPGTKMPTYFDEEYFEYAGPDDILDGDEHEQIRVLRDYILTIK